MPELGPDEVLVEVSHCGICGTDLHLVLEQYARPGIGPRSRVGGHDRRGRRRRRRGWELGDRVVPDPTAGCGECRACRRGRPSVCLDREPPDLLDFTAARSAGTRSVPAGAAARASPTRSRPAPAALTEPTAIALHTVNLVGRHARRPRARHRRRTGRPAHDRGAARARRPRHHGVGAGADAPRARARGRRGARHHARRAPARADGPPGRASRTRWCSSAPGTRAAAEAALDQLDYAGTFVFVGTGRRRTHA